jgi:cysteinyl-tRNA synthetase
MALRFFNTLTRAVQDFVPRDPAGRKVGMYCCGPTVYDFAHIGNFRTFVFADLARRYLEFRGYEVRHVMNITDVEDKIIRSVRASGESRDVLTKRYETEFFRDFDALRCLRPHATPRATEHIESILELIEVLIARGIAYRARDGSVYFSIAKYRGGGGRYGQLKELDFEQMRPGERVSSDEYEKEAMADFALWKARDPEDGAVFWPSPWGEGRPGWHIECSAMSMKLLGPSFDLHLGGEDLIFPHHEDEIAQSEGAAAQAPGEPFVRCWLHGAFLLVEGKKMSKSLGNFFTLRDLLAKGFTGREIRYLLLTAHYREPFNFTLDNLRGARPTLARLDECVSKLVEAARGQAGPPDPALLAKFTEALDGDLNVSAAWGNIFEWVRSMNRQIAEQRLMPAHAASALAAWLQIDRVLGLGPSPVARITVEDESAELGFASQDVVLFKGDIHALPAGPAEISQIQLTELLFQRESARKVKDFQRADALRDELKAKGWVIEDTPKGPRLKRG